MIHVLEGLQQVEHLIMLNVCGLPINEDQLLTVLELEADLGIPKINVSNILMQNLGMKHVMAKFIPQFRKTQWGS